MLQQPKLCKAKNHWVWDYCSGKWWSVTLRRTWIWPYLETLSSEHSIVFVIRNHISGTIWNASDSHSAPLTLFLSWKSTANQYSQLGISEKCTVKVNWWNRLDCNRAESLTHLWPSIYHHTAFILYSHAHKFTSHAMSRGLKGIRRWRHFGQE